MRIFENQKILMIGFPVYLGYFWSEKKDEISFGKLKKFDNLDNPLKLATTIDNMSFEEVQKWAPMFVWNDEEKTPYKEEKRRNKFRDEHGDVYYWCNFEGTYRCDGCRSETDGKLRLGGAGLGCVNDDFALLCRNDNMDKLWDEGSMTRGMSNYEWRENIWLLAGSKKAIHKNQQWLDDFWLDGTNVRR